MGGGMTKETDTLRLQNLILWTLLQNHRTNHVRIELAAKVLDCMADYTGLEIEVAEIATNYCLGVLDISESVDALNRVGEYGITKGVLEAIGQVLCTSALLVAFAAKHTSSISPAYLVTNSGSWNLTSDSECAPPSKLQYATVILESGYKYAIGADWAVGTLMYKMPPVDIAAQAKYYKYMCKQNSRRLQYLLAGFLEVNRGNDWETAVYLNNECRIKRGYYVTEDGVVALVTDGGILRMGTSHILDEDTLSAPALAKAFDPMKDYTLRTTQ